jgi:MYXO-CTERM domain-containing protein
MSKACGWFRSIGWGMAATIVCAGLAQGCSPETEGPATDDAVDPASELPASLEARERLDALRERFVFSRHRGDPDDPAAAKSAPPVAVPVIAASEVTGFSRRVEERIEPLLPPGAKRAVLRSSSVELPAVASGVVVLEDDTSKLSIRFALRGASAAPIAVADGLAIYRGALDGADLVHRVHAEGTEDYVVFESKPAKEELAYEVDVSSVAGLRLVENTLELLDDGGAPRLRVAPPYVIDAKGERHAARLSIGGCTADQSPKAPWARTVTPPGAPSCTVGVSWPSVEYPALVDPSWTTTGSMAVGRVYHTANLLADGRVLVAFGRVSSAELYDPTTGTFAATGGSSEARYYHTGSLLADGRVLIVGGSFSTLSPPLSSALLYNPASGTFAVTGSLATGRDTHTASVLADGRVLVAGGSSGSGYLQSAALYDPSAGTFTATGAIGFGVHSAVATVLGDGRVLIAGGTTSGGVTSAATLYNPATGTFAATGSMSVPRRSHTAVRLGGGSVLVAGGSNVSISHATSELYNPATGTFSPAASMASTRTGHSMSLAGDGRALVAGGWGVGGYLSSAELYEPGGAFKSAGAMATGRQEHTATVLANDAVLIAGGYWSGSGATSSAELLLPTCATDNECASTDYCASDSSCKPRKSLATACNAAAGADCKVSGCRVCTTNYCSDGVCCSTACAAACDVCSVAAGATVNGTCVTAPAGTQTPQCTGGQVCNGTSTACAAVCTSDNDCAQTHYCSAGGACLQRKTQAQTCNASAGADCKVAGCRVCTTNNCVDGYCCNSACGPCGSCAVPQPGSCTPKPAQQPPTPSGSCGLYQCGGATATCPSSCSTAGDCIAGNFCVAGACVSKLPKGSACTADSNCQTGQCADGVCCDTACSGVCLACAAANKQSGIENGTCGVAKLGSNPGNQCVLNPTNPCGTIAACAGTSAACAVVPAGTSCGATQCASETVVSGFVCNGQGECVEQTNQQCAPYKCVVDKCTTPCSVDAHCATGNYCTSGLCVPKTDQGQACSQPSHCKSGFCVDGVCCDGPCNGQCEACDVTGALGQCKTVSNAPHGNRPPCDGSGLCQGKCNGTDPTVCSFPASATSCAPSSCSSADISQPAGYCDGSGSCTVPGTKNCLPYGCDTDTGVCKTGCISDIDCAQGAECHAGTGKCAIMGATCKDSYTVKLPNGVEQSCKPYQCVGGACMDACATTGDCAPGYQCAAPSCVPLADGGVAGSSGSGGSGTGGTAAGGGSAASAGATSPDAGAGADAAADDGGCGCRISERSGPRGDLALLALALASIAARRRRGRRA